MYKEANSAANWLVIYMVNHRGSTLWMSTADLPSLLYNILISDSRIYIFLI